MLRHTSNVRSTWYNLIYRVTTSETDRVYRKLDTKVRVIIQIRRQWDLNPRPLTWRSGNLTTTLRSPDRLQLNLHQINSFINTINLISSNYSSNYFLFKLHFLNNQNIYISYHLNSQQTLFY